MGSREIRFKTKMFRAIMVWLGPYQLSNYNWNGLTMPPLSLTFTFKVCICIRDRNISRACTLLFAIICKRTDVNRFTVCIPVAQRCTFSKVGVGQGRGSWADTHVISDGTVTSHVCKMGIDAVCKSHAINWQPIAGVFLGGRQAPWAPWIIKRSHKSKVRAPDGAIKIGTMHY